MIGFIYLHSFGITRRRVKFFWIIVSTFGFLSRTTITASHSPTFNYMSHRMDVCEICVFIYTYYNKKKAKILVFI